MEKIICDVCGYEYPETEAQCPLCGCAKKDVAKAAAVSTPETQAPADSHVKGGRFSSGNVRKRSKTGYTPMVYSADSREEEEEIEQEQEMEQDKPISNRPLLIIVILLLLAIIAVSTYIAILFSDNGDAASQNQQTTSTTTKPTVKIVECTDIVLNNVVGGVVQFTDAGEFLVLECTRLPEDCVQTFAYSVSNPAVVEIDPDGKIVAKAEGTAVVTVTCGKIEKQIQIVCDFAPKIPENLLNTYIVPESAVPVKEYQVEIYNANQNVNVRKGPATTYDKTTTVKVGQILTVYATCEDPNRPQYPWLLTDEGWVTEQYAKRVVE